jgi:Transmembrane family 220, helix
MTLAVNRVFHGMNWVMCALFLLSVLVQWNDPDPVRSIAIYGAAFAICLVLAVRGRIPTAAPLLVIVVALAWSLTMMSGGPHSNMYSHMFDAWEMKSNPVEEAREATGLLIVGVWMLVVSVARPNGAGKNR